MLTLNKPIPVLLPEFLVEELSTIELSKPFEQRFFLSYPNDFQESLQSFIEQTIDAKITISEGWMNCVKYTGVDNSFDWHNEDGLGSNDGLNEGQYVCIIWLSGETGHGGEFIYMDQDGEIFTVELNPPSMMLIKRDTLHKVNNYTGKTPRISFNFNFDKT